MSAVDIERIIQAHNAVKAQRDAKKRLFDAEDADLKQQQDTLRAYLLDYMNKSGAKSIRTESGTLYRRETVQASAADWGAVWDFAVKNDAMDIFQKRLKTAFVTEYMEENDGAAPPGVNVHRQYDIGVRRN